MPDIMDALAVYSLLEIIKPTLSLEEATQILNVASNKGYKSLESVVERL